MQAKTGAMMSENERFKARLVEEEKKNDELRAQLEVAKSKCRLVQNAL